MYNQFSVHKPMSSVHGHLLEATVVGCYNLKDTEWISKQDPYACLEYGSTKYRTRTCTDGGKHPTFQEKFPFSMIEGLRELIVVVWNSNTVTFDDFIGSGKIQLQKVLSEGFDDSTWPIQTKTGRHAGLVRVILHYANAKKKATSYAPSAFQVPTYPSPPPPAYTTPSPYATYPSHSGAYPPHPSVYPLSHNTYPQPYPPPPHVPALSSTSRHIPGDVSSTILKQKLIHMQTDIILLSIYAYCHLKSKLRHFLPKWSYMVFVGEIVYLQVLYFNQNSFFTFSYCSTGTFCCCKYV